MPTHDFTIEPATPADFDAIYTLAQAIMEEGKTYSYLGMEKERARHYWMGEGMQCFVARRNGEVAGVCTVRPNRDGRADHVANASYLVYEKHRGVGIGKALGEHSLQVAKEAGYEAIQFNFVVSTNKVAVKLWQSLGFHIAGTLPKAFQHAELGLVDVYVMHRFL